MCCAALHGTSVHASKAGHKGKQSGSCNHSGLLSHHMRSAAVANVNGNGYSSRHSSELSMDDEWEPRLLSAIGKVVHFRSCQRILSCSAVILAVAGSIKIARYMQLDRTMHIAVDLVVAVRDLSNGMSGANDSKVSTCCPHVG